jgi:hypothetical protein
MQMQSTNESMQSIRIESKAKTIIGDCNDEKTQRTTKEKTGLESTQGTSV